MTFPTKEAIEQMEIKEVNQQLRQLAKNYQLDNPLKEILTPELWEHLDLIVDTLARLEDRKQWLDQYSSQRGESKV